MANRVVLGEFDGDQVLRVSRPGHNVLNPALERKHLAFDSRWPEVTTIVNSGFVAITGQNFLHPHGGQVSVTGPNVMTWLTDSSGWWISAGPGWVRCGGSQRACFVEGENIRVATGQSLSGYLQPYLQFVTLDSQNG